MMHKIIVTGPVGSGKTTAIHSIVGDYALSTDANASDAITSARKEKTTVAMDYGVITLPNDNIVHLYGTPGQDRFNFMWDILCKGAHGLLLLLDNSRNFPQRDLKHYTRLFHDLIQQHPLVIGVNYMDKSRRFQLRDYQIWLDELGLQAPVIAMDAREKQQVEHALNTLITLKENPQDYQAKQSLFDSNTSNDETFHNSSNSKDLSGEGYQLNEQVIQAILAIKGVKSLTASNVMGETLHSTFEDESLGEFVAYLSDMSATIEKHMQLGEVNRIMLRSPVDENLTVFIEQGSALGVTSDRKQSVAPLSQQVEDLLQWS